MAYPNFELPLILTTDASKVAIAAILSQVQDGNERLIAYASSSLTQQNKIMQSSKMKC
jgi:hypothetical protein